MVSFDNVGEFTTWVTFFEVGTYVLRLEADDGELTAGDNITVIVKEPDCIDNDNDSVCDDSDNCPDTFNPGQEDSDNDGSGNACDACPNDSNKTEPGICGCNFADTDGDNDGTPDCYDQCPSDPDDGCIDNEDNIESIQAYGSQETVNFISASETALKNCRALDNPSPEDSPAGIAFPYGLFSFTIENISPGGDTTMTIILPDEATPTSYYKYGPTPDNPLDHWYEFMDDGETGAIINGNVITLYFVDGKRGDSDLDDTNGIIVDPGGPSTIDASNTPAEASDPAGGWSWGCFIGHLTNE
jgi:hypothetical protein